MLRILFAAVFALGGCATQVLENYVGTSLAQPVMDHGPPSAAFDMGDGRRAFVWTKTKRYTAPGTVVSSGSAFTASSGTLRSNGNHWTYTGQATTNIYAAAIITPPENYAWQCHYTVFAIPIRTDIEGPASWRIVGYQKPKYGCL